MWLANGQEQTYRYIPEMGQLGILLSPLVESTPEFIALYAGDAYLNDKRVVAFQISPRDPKGKSHASYRWWASKFTVTFQKLVVPPAAEVKKFFHFETMMTGPSTASTRTCTGNLDSVNGANPARGDLTARGALQAHGWLADTVGKSGRPVLVLTDGNGQRMLGATRPYNRADVAKYLNQPEMATSGYEASVDISTLSGTYSLDIGILNGDTLELCANTTRRVTITPVQW